MRKKVVNKNFFNVPIAHRGLHGNGVAENSMKAFELAISNNLAIEIDIYRLLDGKFAVFHDPSLKRMTGEDVQISSLSSSELQKYSLFDGQKIPLLEDVLNLINGKVPLLIELKPEDNFKKSDLPALFEILDEYNHYDMVALQCFNPFSILSVKKLKPNVFAGVLSSFKLKNLKGLKLYVAKSLMLLKFVNADFISYDITYLPNKFVAKKKKKGYPLLSWVVKTEEELKTAEGFVNNIIFENLEIAQKYLEYHKEK